MNAKHAKILRWGAKKFKLPYKQLKSAFNKLDQEGKGKFLKQAKLQQNIL